MSASAPTPLLQLQDLSVSYGPVQAVHQVDGTAELRAQAVGGEVGFAGRQRAVVHHQADRLVDHRQPCILVND